MSIQAVHFDSLNSNVVIGTAISSAKTAAETLLLAGIRNPITQGAGAFTITLPALADASGKEWYFYIQTADSGIVTISPTDSDKLYGTITQPTATTIVVDETADSVRFTASTLIGDFIRLWCDGTWWYYEAVTGAAGGIDTTDAA